MKHRESQEVISRVRRFVAPIFIVLVVAFVATGALVRAQRQQARRVSRSDY